MAHSWRRLGNKKKKDANRKTLKMFFRKYPLQMKFNKQGDTYEIL